MLTARLAPRRTNQRPDTELAVILNHGCVR